MASNNTSQRTRTDVRRTLFRSLSRSKPSNTAGAAASSSRSGTGGGSPFEDDDGIVVRNEDGEIDVSDAVKLMQAGTGGAGQSERSFQSYFCALEKLR